MVPKSPKSIQEILMQIDTDSIRNRFSIESESFIHSVPSSSVNAGTTVAMYTQTFIDMLMNTQNVLTAFVDGTFGYCSGIFTQLFIVHINVKKYVGF
jgi:hypothetical protein